jgi:hypothetical protein
VAQAPTVLPFQLEDSIRPESEYDKVSVLMFGQRRIENLNGLSAFRKAMNSLEFNCSHSWKTEFWIYEFVFVVSWHILRG